MKRTNGKTKVGYLDKGNPLTQGLIAFFPFRENGGVIANDIARNHQLFLGLYTDYPVVTSGIAWTSSKYGPALSFSGINYGGIEYEDAHPGLYARSDMFVSTAFTYETIIETSSIGAGTNAVILGVPNWGIHNGLRLQVKGGLLSFDITDSVNNQKVATAGSLFAVPGWKHIVLRFDSRKVNALGQYYSLFIDGVLQVLTYTTGADNNTALAIGGLFNVGGYAPGDYFPGKMSHVRIWDRAIRDTEVFRLSRNPYEMLVSKLIEWTGDALTTVGQPGYRVALYDSNYVKYSEIVSASPLGASANITFELNESGCGAFSLELYQKPELDILKNDIVDIFLMSSTTPWYSGYIQQVPEEGRTDRKYLYSGYGFIAKFDDVFANKTYTATEISAIILDLFNTYCATSGVILDVAKLTATGITLNAVDYSLTNIKKAFFDLMNQAGAFQVGVDENRKLFLTAIDTTIQVAAVKAVAKHLQAFLPKIDSSTVKNKIYVKGAAITGGSNYMITVQDLTSQAANGLKEDVQTIPTTANVADATAWANQLLAILKDAQISGTVSEIDIVQLGEKIEAKGKARIIIGSET